MCLGAKLVEISRKSSWICWNPVVWSRRNFYCHGWKATTCRRAVDRMRLFSLMEIDWGTNTHEVAKDTPTPGPAEYILGTHLSLFKCAENLDSENDDPGSKWWSSRQMLILEERRRATEERLGPKVCTSKRRFRTREQRLRLFEMVWTWHISRFRWILFSCFPWFCTSN